MGVPLGAAVSPEQPADKPHRMHKATTPRMDVRIFIVSLLGDQQRKPKSTT
jgi:hypothetical protein